MAFRERGRGHRVSLIGITDAEERVRAAGLEFVPIGLADYPAGCTRQLFHRLGELSGAAAFRTTVDYFQRATAMLLREAPGALRGQGVEALLVDQTSFGGATVADALDLPFVSVSSALLLNGEPTAARPGRRGPRSACSPPPWNTPGVSCPVGFTSPGRWWIRPAGRRCPSPGGRSTTNR